MGAYNAEAGDQAFRVPISDPTKPEAIVMPVFEQPAADDYRRFGLVLLDGRVYLRGQAGGATMGADFLYRIEADASTTWVNPGVTEIGDIAVGHGTNRVIPPAPGFLSVKTASDEDFRSIGDPAYIYSHIVEQRASGTSWERKLAYEADLYLIGENLYLLGAKDVFEASSQICRVNIRTGENTVLHPATVRTFSVRAGRIYFINEQKQLSSMNLAGGDIKILTDATAETFAVTENDIYYVASADLEIYRLSDGASINPGAQAKQTGGFIDNITGDAWRRYDCFAMAGDYLSCMFAVSDTNPYTVFLISPAGDIVYQAGEEADQLAIDGDKIYIVR
jgi:hypothetical protein